MARAPDPALTARFLADLTAALGRAPGDDERLALGVSGGPDSMAMLALAAAALPGRVMAATVDHRLRLESADEAAMVARACAALGVPHATLVPDEPIARANLQANARAVRYGLLDRWARERAASLLATAHHADDQAETFLMRAARGSGVAGLAGVRPRQVRGEGEPVIVRPLLGWRRAELRALVEDCGLPFVDDPSNLDPHYDRSRFRALLAVMPELDPAQLARAATHAAEADEAIREFERWLWSDRRVAPAGVDDPDGQVWLDITALPRELKRRLARAAIEQVRHANGINSPDFGASSNIEPLLDTLEAGRKASQSGVVVRPRGTVWRFSKAPPRRLS